MDKEKLIAELTKRTMSVPTLEEMGFLSTETITRYLKAREWNLDAAEKALRETIEWRRNTIPQTVTCTWCKDRPGYHNMRQIGFDELGRPVIYSSFSQASTHKNSVEDAIAHTVYLIENAKKSMHNGISSVVLVIDCSGISLPACNPRLGYGVTQILGKHYPERLGQVIIVNTSAMFKAVWKPIKHFLHPSTVTKIKVVKNKKRAVDIFETIFPQDLTKWLLEEIKLNKAQPMEQSQREFWKAPPNGAHDPRGCSSYIKLITEQLSDSDGYRPHPNVEDALKGKELHMVSSSEDLNFGACGTKVNNDHSESSDDTVSEDCVEIGKEFQIPDDAELLES